MGGGGGGDHRLIAREETRARARHFARPGCRVWFGLAAWRCPAPWELLLAWEPAAAAAANNKASGSLFTPLPLLTFDPWDTRSSWLPHHLIQGPLIVGGSACPRLRTHLLAAICSTEAVCVLPRGGHMPMVVLREGWMRSAAVFQLSMMGGRKIVKWSRSM